MSRTPVSIRKVVFACVQSEILLHQNRHDHEVDKFLQVRIDQLPGLLPELERRRPSLKRYILIARNKLRFGLARVFLFLRLAAEYAEVACDNLKTGARLACPVLIRAGLNLAFDENQGTLPEMPDISGVVRLE